MNASGISLRGSVVVLILFLSLAPLVGARSLVAPAAAPATDSPWNPHSSCLAQVTTIEKVNGNLTNSFGGATYAGGGFRPGIPSSTSTSPPCSAGNPANFTFVEIHSVKIVYSVLEDWDCVVNTSYCDHYFNLQDPSCPTIATKPLLCNLFGELQKTWFQAGISPEMLPNNTMIDVQGFVFNNTSPTAMSANHNYSPWEMNPLTAWRIAGVTGANFYLATNPKSPIINQGASSAATLSLLGYNGFAGSIALSLAVPAGLTASLGTNHMWVFSYQQYTNTTTLAVSVGVTTTPGNYLLNVTGVSGALTNTLTITIQVPSFTVSANPTSFTQTADSSGSSIISVTSHSSFSGQVALSVSAPTGISASLVQSNLLVKPNAVNSTTLDVSSSGTPAGIYKINVTGTSGSLTSKATVTVNVIDFSISASPTSLSFASGGFGITGITIASLRLFSGNVSLTASVSPAGPTAKLALNSLLLKPNNTNGTTVRVDSTIPGSYVLNITGTVGSLHHSIFVTVTVPGFAVSVIVGPNKALYWSALSAGTWTSWSAVGFSSPSPPALCGSSSGRLDMIARGMNNVIYHLIFVNSAWSNSTHPWGTALDEPACAVLNGSLHIVVRGTDNGTWYNSMSLSTSQWTGWASLNGFTPSPPFLVASPSANRLDLMVRGMANGIWHKAFINGVWAAAWDSPGGATPSAPAAVSDGSVLHVVVRGLDNVTYYNSLSFSLGVWKGYVSLFGQTPSAPTLTIDSLGTIHLVVQGMNNVPYHKSFSSGTWSVSWDTPFGLTPSAPAAVALGTTLSMLVMGLSGSVYYNSLVGSSWSGWKGLGGSTSETPALGIAQ